MVLKFLKNLFKRSKKTKQESHIPINLTVGQRDSNGYSEVFIDGKPTGKYMLVFTEKQMEKIWEAGDPDYKARKREDKINKILGDE
jgi:hypothetical protein